MNWKTLVKLDIPKFQANRLIHTAQIVDDVLTFGLTRNKYKANVCHLKEIDDSYSIIYYKVSKPKYDHKNNQFIPFMKEEKFRKDQLSLEEVKSILTNSFK